MSAISDDLGKVCPTTSIGTTTSSFWHSLRPSRRINGYGDDEESTPSNALGAFGSLDSQFTPLEALITVLQSTGLPGPILLIGAAEFIGSGSQFAVYKQKVARSTNGPGFRSRTVAVKQPKFSLDPDQGVNLSDPDMRKHLHDMHSEILALTIPRLREHPNIARLFGWGYNSDAFHTLPLLIMDLAFDNLESVLNNEANLTSIVSRVTICYGVSLGLDAIHECKIIHGDLKPANVLLYIENSQLVAKLADFGLSTAEADTSRGVRLGGTPGWRAPEVEENKLLYEDDLIRADNYSYGLLIWRVVLHRGRICPSAQLKNIIENVVNDFRSESSMEEWQYHQILEKAIIDLLVLENEERPLKIAPLLSNLELADLVTSAIATSIDSEDDDSTYSDLEPVPYPSDAYFKWELSPVSSLFKIDLYERFLKQPESFSLDILEALFLDLTLSVDSCSSDLTEKPIGEEALNILCIAALNGSVAARAMVPSVYRCFRQKPHPEIEKRIREWLISATESGSVLASQELKIENELDVAENSLNHFRRCGGYNQYFDDVYLNLEHDDCESSQRSFGERKVRESLANLIKFEPLEATEAGLQDLKKILPYLSDPADEVLDSLLYYACVRGSWAIAKQLLTVGCTARWKEPTFNLSCLHWVFAISAEYRDDAIKSLLSKAADIGMMAIEVVPLPFAPYLLPAGTALHWAVVLSCDQTIDLLLDHGADPLTRDGSDPYLFDDDVRPFDKFGGLDWQGFSIPKEKTVGLTSLDYAAIRYSPHIFRALRIRSLEIDINSTDEEGFTVLHRLSTSTTHRTRLGIEYSIEPMQPSASSRRMLVAETLQAILAIGGDLEALTYGRHYDNTWTSEEYTPLMLAVQRGETVVVKCLLEAGAKVQTQNNKGRTALHFCPSHTSKDDYLYIVKVLCEYGADLRAKDKRGDTPLIVAAAGRAFRVVEYLLSAGADIDVYCSVSETNNQFGQREDTVDTVFSLLLTENIGHSIDPDRFIAGLVDEYVIKHPDSGVRGRLLGMTQTTGTPLLYSLASRNMPQCVALLLREGVNPNIKTKQWLFRRDDRETQVWYETPLDGLRKEQHQRRIRMERDGHYSAQVYELMCDKSRAVESLLREAGGYALLSDEEHIQGVPNPPGSTSGG